MNSPRFKVLSPSYEANITALTLACKNISNELNSIFENTKIGGFINPYQVLIVDKSLNLPASHSNIWVEVNSTWEVAEEARLKLEKLGFQTIK